MCDVDGLLKITVSPRSAQTAPPSAAAHPFLSDPCLTGSAKRTLLQQEMGHPLFVTLQLQSLEKHCLSVIGSPEQCLWSHRKAALGSCQSLGGCSSRYVWQAGEVLWSSSWVSDGKPPAVLWFCPWVWAATQTVRSQTHLEVSAPPSV